MLFTVLFIPRRKNMNRLEYHFDCLDGRCLFICKFDEGSLNYDLESTIAEIPASFGELSRDDSELFNKYIAQANIPGWEKEYEPVLCHVCHEEARSGPGYRPELRLRDTKESFLQKHFPAVLHSNLS